MLDIDFLETSLFFLMSRQTPDEIARFETIYLNNVGVSKSDAGVATAIYTEIKRGKPLKHQKKAIKILKEMIPKYGKQLSEMGR